MKKFKKVLSLILAVAMILPLFPTPEVYAEEVVNSQFSISKSGNGAGMIMVNDSSVEESLNQTYEIGEKIEVNAKASEGSIIDFVKVTNGEKEENISYDEMSEYSNTFTVNADDLKVEISFAKKEQKEEKNEATDSGSELPKEDAIPNSESKPEREPEKEPVKDTPKKYTDRSEPIGTAIVVSKEELENGIKPFSTPGSNVTITPGKHHSYGSWGTCEFDMATETGHHLGFCAEPNFGTPSGTFQVSILDDKIEKNANIKAAILCYVVPELYEALGKNIYNEKDNNTYAYCHAVIGYMYSGSLTGLSSSMADGVRMMHSAINTHRQNNATLISYMNQYKVYVAYNSQQDIVWVEKNEEGKAGLKKESANPSITNGNNYYSLAGAVYGVYSDAGCTNKVGDLTTDASGNTNTISLNAGTYYVKEITPSKGYELDTKIYTVNVQSGKTATVTSKEPPKSGKIKLLKSSANTGITNGNNNYSLAGAEYSVYKNASCTDLVNKIVTGANGEGSLDNLPLGIYYVKETKASQGYELDKTVYTVDISNGNTAVIEKTVNSKETPKVGKIKLKKASGNTNITNANNNYSLAGAEYSVYKNASCTDYVNKITTDRNGEGSLENLPLGVYYVKETKASQGYELDKTVYTADISNGNTAVIEKTVNSKEPPKVGRIKLEKVSAKPDITDGNKNYSLAGAEYSVYKNASCTDYVNKIITDDKGKGSLDNLPLGVYYVKETKASSGYILDKTVYTADVSRGDTAVIETTVKSKETPLLDPTAILLKKVDSETGDGTPQGSASLADAHFKVKYYPVIMDTDPANSGHTAQRTWVLKTDSRGFLALDNEHKVSGDEFFTTSDGTPALPFGTLTFEEIKAPEGYLINPKIIVCKIDKSPSEGIIYQEPVQKENVLRMDIEKIQAGVSKPIKGVVFEHTKPDGSKETLTTDENGQLSFKGLQWGEHTVKEISAPDGYSLNTNIITFTVGKDNKITITSKGVETDTDGNIKITVTKDGNINAVVEDKPAPYELLIHKVNEKDKVLEGAEFTLYSDAECKQEIAKEVSKSDGTLRFDNLIVGKTYYMKETKAPEGYRIPVNPDGSDIVYTIKAESIPVDNIFRVIINGKEYDSNSNGDFKVTGTKADRVVDMTITNHTTKKLPETGSYWMIPILILGVGLMIYGMKKTKNPHGEEDNEKTMDTKKNDKE